jgi:hypothetical protein
MLFVGDCNDCCAPPPIPTFIVWHRFCQGSALVRQSPDFFTPAEAWDEANNIAWECGGSEGAYINETCDDSSTWGTLGSPTPQIYNDGTDCPAVLATLTFDAGIVAWTSELFSGVWSATGAKAVSRIWGIRLPLDPGETLRSQHGIYTIEVTTRHSRVISGDYVTHTEQIPPDIPATYECLTEAFPTIEANRSYYGAFDNTGTIHLRDLIQDHFDGNSTFDQSYTNIAGGATTTISNTTSTEVIAAAGDNSWYYIIAPNTPEECHGVFPFEDHIAQQHDNGVLSLSSTVLGTLRHSLSKVTKVRFLDSGGGEKSVYLF